MHQDAGKGGDNVVLGMVVSMGPFSGQHRELEHDEKGGAGVGAAGTGCIRGGGDGAEELTRDAHNCRSVILQDENQTKGNYIGLGARPT